MPGPVSDRYDPEFGAGDNAHEVREAVRDGINALNRGLGGAVKDIVAVAVDDDSPRVQVALTEREARALRFAAIRAIETI